MSSAGLLDALARADPERLPALGEAVLEASEHTARRDPRELARLYGAVRGAAERGSSFRPWAAWAEGIAEHVVGHPRRAARLLDAAARGFRRRGDAVRAARVDFVLMDALACLGRHRAAAARGRRAVGVFESAGDRRRAAYALANLAGLADARDQVRRAAGLWQRARRLLDPADRRHLALVDTSLAGALQALGRFAASERLYRRAAVTFEEEGLGAAALQPRLGLAEVLALRGDLAAARDETLALSARAAELGDDDLSFQAAVVLARVELDIGHPERTLEIAEAAVPRCRKAGRLDDAARLAALAALAAAELPGRDGDAARREAEAALAEAGLPVPAAALRAELALAGRPGELDRARRDAAVLERAGLAAHADLARLAAATRLLERGHAAAADRLCRRVLARRGAGVRPRLLARTLRARTRPERAIAELRAAVRLAESVRGRLAAEHDRVGFARRTAEAYEALVAALLERDDPRSRRQAFALVARAKSRTLLEAMNPMLARRWRGRPDLVARWVELRRELAGMLAPLEGGDLQGTRYVATAVASRFRRTALRLEQLERELTAVGAPLAVAIGRARTPALGPLLEPGEVLLESFLAGDDLVTFRVDRRGLGVTRRRGAREAVESTARALQFQLGKAAYGRRHLAAAGAVLVEQVRSRLAALGELLLAPLDGQPAPTRLFLAPHGPLHLLPAAALELGGAPVLAACPVAVVPGSGVLARLLGRPAAPPRTLGIAGAETPGLPEVAAEIGDLASRFGSAEVVSDAPVAAVLELLGRCDAVHVAGHGAFQPLLPEGSGLRLADGWLTALDILRTPVAARLVTVGACASGAVAVGRGDELAGLLRALLAAGVRTAVLAPGSLDDTLGREAARRFYDILFEVGPGEALRRTSLELRAEHPHPALWAALQLYGDPRPWEKA